jgi:hypothetical protein
MEKPLWVIEKFYDHVENFNELVAAIENNGGNYISTNYYKLLEEDYSSN